MTHSKSGRALALAAALAVSAGPAFADEGMWTFDNFPLARVNAAYGLKLDQKWLDRVQAASVRLTTGCSASLVSPQGLVLTNHHCVVECVQDLSSGQTDYVKDGFLTAGRAEERKCPGMQAEVLVSIDDVTDEIKAASAGKAGQDFVRARDAAQAAAESRACAGDDRFRCQTVSLYRGGLQVPQVLRRPAGLRAGARHRVLRRRSGQLQLPPLQPRYGLPSPLRGRAAGGHAPAPDLGLARATGR
jgi:hypothetical protein